MVNIGHNVDNIRRYTSLCKVEALNHKVAAIQCALKEQLRPLTNFPKVNYYLAHFKKIRSRYPFLVIEGQSGTRKTLFAKWLLNDADRCFEVNCAATPEPDLRDFDSTAHQNIVFDEAPPEMVIRQKKLFQGPPVFVDLGSSATNCHGYKVFVSGTKMIICSNNWETKKSQLSVEDREWLDRNSVYLNVGDEKMYVE